MSNEQNTASNEFPGLGMALDTIANAALSHKELLGAPEVYASIYHQLSSAYTDALAAMGRPLMPTDVYALQVIEALATHAIRPGAPALLTAGRACAVGAGMAIALQDAAERRAKAEAAPAKPEDDVSEHVAAFTDGMHGVRDAFASAKPEDGPSNPLDHTSWVIAEGEELNSLARDGDSVHLLNKKTGLTGYIGVVAKDKSGRLFVDRDSKPGRLTGTDTRIPEEVQALQRKNAAVPERMGYTNDPAPAKPE